MKESIKGINIRGLFSKNVKRLRNISNMSQASLADATGLTHNFINDIENGKKWVSAETVGKLSKALKAEPYQFFISDAKWNDQATEMFSLYLDDLEITHAKMVAEYRRRFLTETYANEEPEAGLQADREKAEKN